MAQYPNIERALRQIGKDIQSIWAERVGKKTGRYRRAVQDTRNVEATPRTMMVGRYARSKIEYAQYQEGGHRAFALPRRIRNWDYSAAGKPYKRVAFVPQGETERIVRTITPQSKGFRIPAVEGLNNAEVIPRMMRAKIISTLKRAAVKDGTDLIRSAIATTLGRNQYVKIRVK